MENNAGQPGQQVDPQEALRRLQELEEETKRLRAQLTSQAAGETGSGEEGKIGPKDPVASAEKPAADVDPEKPPQPTEQQREEADKLIQRYRLEKQRGNKDFASRYLGEAAQIAPGYTYVLECQGDEAADSRKIEEAKRLYKLAKAQDIRNTSAESKFADLVFRSQAAPASAHLKIQETSANQKWAGILSAIVPGTGQIVTGYTVKGAIILVLWVLLLFTVPTGIKSAGNLFGNRTPVEGWAIVCLVATFGLYFFNLVDMSATSKASAARDKLMGLEHKKPEKPKPPEESGGKPFE